MTDDGITLNFPCGVCKRQQQQQGAQNYNRLSHQQILEHDSKTIHRTVQGALLANKKMDFKQR